MDFSFWVKSETKRKKNHYLSVYFQIAHPPMVFFKQTSPGSHPITIRNMPPASNVSLMENILGKCFQQLLWTQYPVLTAKYNILEVEMQCNANTSLYNICSLKKQHTVHNTRQAAASTTSSRVPPCMDGNSRKCYHYVLYLSEIVICYSSTTC